MPFSNLMLSEKLQKTINELGYTEPTPIQQRAIPQLRKGNDVIATSQTGTGKTASFVLPMLENISEPKRAKQGDDRYRVDALILVSTRELALQIHNNIENYAKEFKHKSVPLYGGVKLGGQINQIRSGANIVVATTGRLLDHISNGTVNLSSVKMVIIDEADKLLEMGFIDDVRQIITKLPKRRVSAMFSATFPPTIIKLAKSLLNNPTSIEIDPDNIATKKVKQIVHYIDEEQKTPLLSFLIGSKNWKQVLVFVNTKHKANALVEHLNLDGLKSLAIHGDKTQGLRNKALRLFKEEKVRVLVATDVVARGIDIINLPHVINFELPLKNEDYIHRIGRTGRAKQNGEALSLVCAKEAEQLKEIEKLVGKTLPIMTTDEFTYDSSIKPKNKRVKKETKAKKGVDLKKAKELAERMMSRDKSSDKKRKTTKRDHYKSPKNKRHF
jgi:ATP-dependent RNA helicase RhlE